MLELLAKERLDCARTARTYVTVRHVSIEEIIFITLERITTMFKALLVERGTFSYQCGLLSHTTGFGWMAAQRGVNQTLYQLAAFA